MNIPSYWERDFQDLQAWWRRATPDSIFLGLFGVIGGLVGGLGAVISFVVVYLAAIESAGWVVGIALGWIAASLAAGIAYFLGRYFWWALPFLVRYVYHTFF